MARRTRDMILGLNMDTEPFASLFLTLSPDDRRTA